MIASRRHLDIGPPLLRAALLAVLVLAITQFALSATPAASAPCPNEALREAQGVLDLPDCMALEMVSPPRKLVAPAFEPSFSLNGERLLYRSMAALAGTPGLHSPFGDRYVADRGPGGWATTATSAPAGAMIVGGGGAWKGGPNSFSPDLSRWILLGFTQEQEALGIGQAFQGGLDGSFGPLSPALEPIGDVSGGGLDSSFVEMFVPGASWDSSSIVLQLRSASTSYFPVDPRGGGTGAATNAYVAALRDGVPTLALLARDKGGKAYGGRCGSTLGFGKGVSTINQGAISADGSRIYFTTRPAQPESVGSAGPPCDPSNPLRIMRRLETPTGPEVTELLPGGPSAPGDDLYQGASADGTRAYFTSPRKLAASDADASSEECRGDLGSSKGCDLYLYDSTLPEGERVIQVSAGGAGDPSPGQGADVLSSITALSGDGSHAYFVAQGVLTTDPNPEGDVAVGAEPNLYAYRRDSANPSGHIAFVGTLAKGDEISLWGSGQSFIGAYAVPLLGADPSEPEVGGDGHILAFASKAPLTADDTDGGFRDVFRYDASGETLERISKAAPGGSDNGPFDVLANPNQLSPLGNYAGEGRWASEDGQTVAFATAEALDPADEDGANNPYFWKAGQVGRIAGAIPTGGGFPNRPPSVSLDGSQVAAAITTPLLPQDTDTASDVYLARAGGGFPLPPQPIPCQPSACQGPPAPRPSLALPASRSSSGNVKGARCKKRFVKRHGRCVHKPRKRNRGRQGKATRRGARG